jgi:hypothetical protein
MKKIVGVYLLAFAGAVTLSYALQAAYGLVFATQLFFPFLYSLLLYLPVLILHALLLHVLGAAVMRRIAVGWVALPVAVYAVAGSLACLSLRAERDLIAEIDAENARRVAVPSLPLAFTEWSSAFPARLLFLYDIPAVFDQQRIPVVYTYQGEGCRDLPGYVRDFVSIRRGWPPDKRPCLVRNEAVRPASVVLITRGRESFKRYLASADLTVVTVSIVDQDGVRQLLRLRSGWVGTLNPLWFTVPNFRVQSVGAVYRELEALAASLSLPTR